MRPPDARDRIKMGLLSAAGWSPPRSAAHLGCHAKTVRQLLDRFPRVKLAGMVVCRQRPGTARGVLFLLLEDEFGLTNVVVHPSLYERQRSVLRTEPFMIVHGIVQRRGPSVSVLARSVERLPRPNNRMAPQPIVEIASRVGEEQASNARSSA
jgi:DNA polymerase III alpha subunit